MTPPPPGVLWKVKLSRYLLWVCFLILALFTSFVLFSDTRLKQLQGLAIDNRDIFILPIVATRVLPNMIASAKPY
ncbi:MAG: hypothetical protein JWP00_150 [Chloroflexi bacterium]|nr:hypothetical protein [Chloroflexota bacterium]